MAGPTSWPTAVWRWLTRDPEDANDRVLNVFKRIAVVGTVVVGTLTPIGFFFSRQGDVAVFEPGDSTPSDSRPSADEPDSKTTATSLAADNAVDGGGFASELPTDSSTSTSTFTPTSSATASASSAGNTSIASSASSVITPTIGIEGRWTGRLIQANDQWNMVLVLEKPQSGGFFEGVSNWPDPDLGNTTARLQGKIATSFGDLAEESKWRFVHSDLDISEGQWVTWENVEYVSGSGIRLNTPRRAHVHTDGSMHGVWFWDSTTSEPLGSFEVFLAE